MKKKQFRVGSEEDLRQARVVAEKGRSEHRNSTGTTKSTSKHNIVPPNLGNSPLTVGSIYNTNGKKRLLDKACRDEPLYEENIPNGLGQY